MCLSLLFPSVVTSCGKEESYRPAPATQLASFVVALDAFAQDCGRYPTSAEGLDALLKCPNAIPAKRWRGPYLQGTNIPADLWGHAYVYRSPSASGAKHFDLYSCGPDGVSKTGGKDPDDINWPPNSQRAR